MLVKIAFIAKACFSSCFALQMGIQEDHESALAQQSCASCFCQTGKCGSGAKCNVRLLSVTAVMRTANTADKALSHAWVQYQSARMTVIVKLQAKVCWRTEPQVLGAGFSCTLDWNQMCAVRLQHLEPSCQWLCVSPWQQRTLHFPSNRRWHASMVRQPSWHASIVRQPSWHAVC